MKQPATAKQIANQHRLSFDVANKTLIELTLRSLVSCLNSHAVKSRLYWLTSLGTNCQTKLRREQELPPLEHEFPVVDWDVYGSVCFSHRSEIIKALKEPLQPSAIKRKARSRNPSLRMSANNVRDVIRIFKQKGIVRPVIVPKQLHPRYELTYLGKDFQKLLMAAERI